MKGKAKHSPRLIHRAAAVLCLVGCVAAVLGDVTTTFLRGLNPIEHTVSRSAKGAYSFIADTGIVLFASGAAALALTLADLRLDGQQSKLGAAILVVLSIAALVLGVWNGYDRKDAEDLGVHMLTLYVLAATFPIAAALLAEGLTELRPWAGRFSLGTALVWTAMGPMYFVMPDGVEGGFERAALLVLIAWSAVVAGLVLGAPRRAQRPRQRDLAATSVKDVGDGPDAANTHRIA